jgi:hypothetical protein
MGGSVTAHFILKKNPEKTGQNEAPHRRAAGYLVDNLFCKKL